MEHPIFWERRPWEERFQMNQGQAETIAKACRDLESLGNVPTVQDVYKKVRPLVTEQQVETYLRQTSRIEEREA